MIQKVCLCRYEMIQKVKSLQTQLGLMSQIVSQMKKDKESAAKQVKDIEAALTAYIHKIRVRGSA